MKGATPCANLLADGAIVSIHAPVKGATLALGVQEVSDTSFNPRTREGCDIWRSVVTGDQACFNPRTREGCDTGTGT